jgi:hypothetical protein
MTDYSNAPGYYAVKMRHDDGEITIYTFSMSAAAARSLVLRAERAPDSAVLEVRREPPSYQVQPELAEQVTALGYVIAGSKESDDCFIFSATYWEEDSGDFDTATEAAEFLIKAKS